MDLAMAMMEPAAAAPYLIASTLMWVVMMSAMMTPAVVPVVLVFNRLDRGRNAQLDGLFFASGYLLVWLVFAVAGTLVQWGLHRAALLHAHVLFLGPALAGFVLLGAGVYQLTPLKTACLKHCRAPLGFLLNHWREGKGGALIMGLRHGSYCVGCCWALMLLMFVGGVMSVAAMVMLTSSSAERLLRADRGENSGAALIAGVRRDPAYR
jgi:predicted metal-binding membrane protein